MSFIKINLNQTVSKAQREFIIEEKNRWYIFMGICALFLVSFMWLIFINSCSTTFNFSDKLLTRRSKFHFF